MTARYKVEGETNPHEEAARARKVLRIVEAAVAVLRGGSGATMTAGGALRAARRWDAESWKKVALIAGQRPPSAETRLEVIASLARMVPPS